MDDKSDTKGLKAYDHAAGGWGALKAVARAVRTQMNAVVAGETLLRENQPDGFDCPGCAWPDPKHRSTFEFCENGAKAVTWEATKKRATPDVFATHRVSDLLTWRDHDIENLGRLTHPMRYDKESDTYVEISWEDAFARIAVALNDLPDPDMAEFYTSGRASNEAAFLFQLFVRAYGTNNFPDCSNMCHEATSVGLAEVLGIGKASVSLEDFDHTDGILAMGHNPGTNHPRMMTTLREVAKRGAPIIAFNPMRERSLERFTSPQSPIEMTTGGSTPIASDYLQVRVGGDIAALKGIVKGVLELERAAIDAGSASVLDHDFIAEHTEGFEAVAADVAATSWDDIERVSGLSREALQRVAGIYASLSSVIVTYGMGITQHAHGTEAVQYINNLLMMRGNIGRQGAGICPLRGHSNVQGDRTVGIDEKAPKGLSDGIQRVYGFDPPREHGHNAVEAMLAMLEGRSKVMVSLGGNLAVAMPDARACAQAQRNLDLVVHIATKPNRSHLLLAKDNLLLPCLGRTDRDIQATGPQSVTVEDTMSMVHASQGALPPPSDAVRSEPWIVAQMARAVLGSRFDIPWEDYSGNYDLVRDAIEAVLPIFASYNERIREPGGFRLPLPSAERIWKTKTGKAAFRRFEGLGELPAAEDVLILTSVRSHDQYNTTIYSHDDRYRGVWGRRDVVFMNPEDMAARGLKTGDAIDVESIGFDGRLNGFRAVAHDIARGCAAAYYPEANVLMPLESYDRQSGTPTYKSTPIRISRVL
jgi:molybdopterin-dependent oxidoreductase alpha subunit